MPCSTKDRAKSNASTACGELTVASVQSAFNVLAPFVSNQGMMPAKYAGSTYIPKTLSPGFASLPAADENSSHVQSSAGSSTPASRNIFVLYQMHMVLNSPGR